MSPLQGEERATPSELNIVAMNGCSKTTPSELNKTILIIEPRWGSGKAKMFKHQCEMEKHNKCYNYVTIAV